MKKIFNLILIFAMTVSFFVGCAPTETEDKTNTITANDIQIVNSRYVKNVSETMEYEVVYSYATTTDYYYIIKLGTVTDVVMDENYTAKYYSGVGFAELTFTTSQITTTSVTRKTEQISSSLRYENNLAGWNVSIGVEVLGSGGQLAIGHNYYQNSTTTTDSESNEEKQETTIITEEQQKQTFTPECPVGFYRIVNITNVDVFAIVVKNIATQKSEFNIFSLAQQPLTTVIDYSEQRFNDNKIDLSNFSFDIAFAENLTIPEQAPPQPPEPLTPQTYTISTDPKNCTDNNGYDTSKPISDNHIKTEIDPNIFNIVLKGAYQIDTSYIALNTISLSLKVLQTPDSISLTKESNSLLSGAHINSDSWSDRVKNTNLIGKSIGKGAIYLRINYTDNTFDEGYSTNILEGQAINSTIDLLKATNITIKSSKSLHSIKIITVYEINRWKGYPIKSSTAVTNWRTENTITFEEQTLSDMSN